MVLERTFFPPKRSGDRSFKSYIQSELPRRYRPRGSLHANFKCIQVDHECFDLDLQLRDSRFYADYALPTLRNLGHKMNLDPNGGVHNGVSWEFLVCYILPLGIIISLIHKQTALPDTSTRSYAVSGYCKFCISH